MVGISHNKNTLGSLTHKFQVQNRSHPKPPSRVVPTHRRLPKARYKRPNLEALQRSGIRYRRRYTYHCMQSGKIVGLSKRPGILYLEHALVCHV